MWHYPFESRFNAEKPLLQQLANQGLEFDPKLQRALELSASKPDLSPEDTGFPDSYLTLALYRLNSILTRVVDLDERRYNLFHNYKLAPSCQPEEVVPGFRLCGVLHKAAELAEPKKTIGVGHFLKAIVALSLDQEPEPAYGFKDQVIHKTFSAETLLWGLGYTAWTPLSDAPEVQELLRILDGREPIESFQYLMAFESNRIVFRPASVLNTYRMQAVQGHESTRLAVLTHFRDQYAGVTPSEILELEDLINDPRVRELELQRFFEAHPNFLRLWSYNDVYPHVYLTREDEGPLIPDFILIDRELQKAMILDLKLPRFTTVIQKRNRERFSAAVADARAQLLEYKDWFGDASNRAKLKEKLGMEVYRPRIGVVIGTNEDFQNAFQRQKIVSRHSDVEVVTYDDIIQYAQRRLLLVKGAARDSSREAS